MQTEKKRSKGNEVIIPEMGDYLLIDPDLDSPMTSGDPFDVTTSKDRLLVSKLIGVGRRLLRRENFARRRFAFHD